MAQPGVVGFADLRSLGWPADVEIASRADGFGSVVVVEARQHRFEGQAEIGQEGLDLEGFRPLPLARPEAEGEPFVTGRAERFEPSGEKQSNALGRERRVGEHQVGGADEARGEGEAEVAPGGGKGEGQTACRGTDVVEDGLVDVNNGAFRVRRHQTDRQRREVVIAETQDRGTIELVRPGQVEGPARHGLWRCRDVVEAPPGRWEACCQLSHPLGQRGLVRVRGLGQREGRQGVTFAVPHEVRVQRVEDRFDVPAGQAAVGHELGDGASHRQRSKDAPDAGEIQAPIVLQVQDGL